jgi:prevent-host-death family protein
MKVAKLSDAKDDLSRCLRRAEAQPILITRHGRPAGLLIGFASEEDWLDYRAVQKAELIAGRSGRSWPYQ